VTTIKSDDQSTRAPIDHGAPWDGATLDAWRSIVEKDLKGAPFEKKLVAHTLEGLDIQPLYCADDIDASVDPSGFPGLPPFARAPTVLGLSAQGADLREERAEPEPGALNRVILEDLERGATSVELRLNDALGRVARGEPGAVLDPHGVVLCSVDDLDRSLGGVHLEMITLSLAPGALFVEAAALVHALYSKRRVPIREASFAINADPLAERARTGTAGVPVKTAIERAARTAAWLADAWPGATAWRVNTVPYHDAGATAAQDLACSMATALEYLRGAERIGVSPIDTARSMVFQYSVSCNQFLAIAKLRAARRLWWRVLESCGVDAPERGMRLQTRTARRSLTRRDPWVNLLRNTVGNLIGSLGGAETIISVPFDAPVGGAPSALGRRLARNTHTILAEESHLESVIDPAGGSWYIERLTEDLAHAAWAVLQDIEREGGMADALSGGWIAGRIEHARESRRRNIATRRFAITGVSEFALLDGETEGVPTHETPDPAALTDAARARLSIRSPKDAREHIERLAAMARDPEASIARAAAEAAENGANLADLTRALDTGRDDPIAPIAPHSYAQEFEALRDASDAYEAQTGARPSVFLANLGPVAVHTARARYAEGFFHAGGFAVISNDGFEATEDVARAFEESGAGIAVICSSDERYAEQAAPVARALHRAGARVVVLAGRPGAHEAAYRESGVDRFIFIGCDVHATLSEMLGSEGVRV